MTKNFVSAVLAGAILLSASAAFAAPAPASKEVDMAAKCQQAAHKNTEECQKFLQGQQKAVETTTEATKN